MSGESRETGLSGVAWRRLSRGRPWYRRLASIPLAEAAVESADGEVYLVRVRKNSPVVVSRGLDGSDPVSSVIAFLKANLDAGGETGWRIDVVASANGWSGERVLYSQHVGAQAIVVDVILAVTGALERGEKLWRDDKE